MKQTFIPLFFLLLFFSTNKINACNLSELSLISYTDNGTSHDYAIELCIGGGVSGASQGADNATETFAIGLHVANSGSVTVSNFTPSLTSTETQETYNSFLAGAQPGAPFEAEEVIGFMGADPFLCINSTAQCGNVHQDCFTINFTTNVALEGIEAFGIEGLGNPAAGCFDAPDMFINMNALPVEFGSFTALQQEETAELNWQTVSEQSTDYFGIEKSNDGWNFTEIGRVEAYGNSNSTLDYQFTDKNLSFQTTYYRLRQVDKDGSYEYSKVVHIHPERIFSALKIFPNPIQEYLHVCGDSFMENRMTIIEIFTLSGYLVKRKEMIVEDCFAVYADDLKAGIYILKVMNGQEVDFSRFAKG